MGKIKIVPHGGQYFSHVKFTALTPRLHGQRIFLTCGELSYQRFYWLIKIAVRGLLKILVASSILLRRFID